jgi:hypothetical protein
MPYSVRCKACSAVFAIPDDIWDRRVRGRTATLKCRSCRGDIEVDGSKADAGKLSDLPPPAPSSPTPAVVAIPPTPPATIPKPEPVVEEKKPVAVKVAEAPQVAPVATPPPSSIKPEVKPKAVAPSEIAAAESGWSIMPPPAELEVIKGPAIQPPTLVTAPSPPLVEAQKSDATVTSVVGEKPAPVAAPVQEKSTPVSTVESSTSATDVPDDLWVVSYGDEDDRELTEKQIAAELSRGKINATTIVWRESMPEWLPISGVPELSKYLPNPKSRPLATKSPVLPKTTLKAGTTTPSVKQEPKAVTQPKTAPEAPTTTAGKQPKAPISPTVSTEKQPALPPTGTKRSPQREAPGDIPKVLGGGSSTHGSKASSAKQNDIPAVLGGGSHLEKQGQPKAPTGVAKGPPPLTRSAQKSSDDVVSSTEPGSRVPQPSAGKPPTLPGRTTKTDVIEASVPWRKAQESTDEGVLTSAPDIEKVSSPDASIPTPTAVDPPPFEEVPSKEESNLPLAAAKPTFPTAKTESEPVASSSPTSHPSMRATSFRPPKPVETATSLVVHTKGATKAGVLEITDDDFLAMQRRFPKWALPAAIFGAVAVVGLIIYALTSGEEPPPLPVAPVIVPNSAESVTAGERQNQPDLEKIPKPTGSANGANANGDFASAFAKAANKGVNNFDSKAAERSAGPAIERAAKCHTGSDPLGIVRVVVTLAPSGQVTDVQVNPPYATLPTGKCIDKALRTFSIKPFQGDAAKLPLSFNLR